MQSFFQIVAKDAVRTNMFQRCIPSYQNIMWHLVGYSSFSWLESRGSPFKLRTVCVELGLTHMVYRSCIIQLRCSLSVVIRLLLWQLFADNSELLPININYTNINVPFELVGTSNLDIIQCPREKYFTRAFRANNKIVCQLQMTNKLSSSRKYKPG